MLRETFFFSDIVLTKLEKLAAAKKLLFGQERNAEWLQLKHPSYLILLASEKKVRTSPFHRQNSQKSSMLSGVQVPIEIAAPLAPIFRAIQTYHFMWQTQQSNIPNFTMGGLNHPRKKADYGGLLLSLAV